MRRITGLAAVALAVLSAAPAHATITSVSPAGIDGAPTDTFATNEILYVTGVNNALAGGAQVCVVDAYATGEGSCAKHAAWGSPNAIATHGTFAGHPIEAPMLPVGTWRILADNGDEDTDPDDVVSDQFTVTPCPPEDECSTAIADAVMADWKQAAQASRDGTGFACLNTSVFNQGGGPTAGGAIAGAERNLIMAEISGNGVSLSLSPGGSLARAVNLLRVVSCGALVMYDDIVKDPPDPDYEHLAEPQVEQMYALADDPAVGAAAQALQETAAYGVAHRIGVERYLGAVDAGDAGWAAVQATRLGEQALATQSRMRRLGEQLDAAAAAVSDPSLTAATTEELNTAKAIRERIRISGFTADELADLEALGLTATEIADVRTQLGAPLPQDATPMTPAAALLHASDQIDTATCIDDTDLCGFDSLGRVASAAGANGTIPPTIEVTPLQIRESDVGVNHGRVRIELSHPVLAHPVVGGLELDPGTTAEAEVAAPDSGWSIPEGRTRTYRSVTVANDTAVEEDEVAQLTAGATNLPVSSGPVTVTVLDDDGPGDPASPPRSVRGVIATLGRAASGAAVFVSEPDATELTPLYAGDFLASKWIPAWSPDGRWLIAQHVAPTLSALQTTGEPVYRLRVTPDGTITDEPVEVIEGKPYPAYPTFSADGRRLLMSQYRDGSYKLAVFPFDTETGQAGPVHVTGDDPPLENWWSGHGASFNPDRTRIAFAGCAPGFDPCGIFVVPVDGAGAATGPPVNVRPAKANDVMFPSWSPDGKFITFRSFEGDAMRVLNLPVDATGQPLATERTVFTGPRFSSGGLPAWAPDSKSVAFSVPVDPMLPLGEGGAALIVDIDGEGAPVGEPRHLGLTGWSPEPVWGTLPDPPPAPPGENPESTPTPTPTPTPTGTATPEPAQTPPPATTPTPAVSPAILPSNRKCVSRRRFTIRLRESKDDPLARVKVFLGKKRVKVVAGERLTAKIDLRGLPKGRFTVRIVGVTQSGRKAVSKRRYRTCAPKRKRG